MSSFRLFNDKIDNSHTSQKIVTNELIARNFTSRTIIDKSGSLTINSSNLIIKSNTTTINSSSLIINSSSLIINSNSTTINGSLILENQLLHGIQVNDPSNNVHGVIGNIVGTTDSQILINKTLTDVTNSCRAVVIGTNSSNIIISSIPPMSGQVLTAIDSVNASWTTINPLRYSYTIDPTIGQLTYAAGSTYTIPLPGSVNNINGTLISIASNEITFLDTAKLNIDFSLTGGGAPAQSGTTIDAYIELNTGGGYNSVSNSGILLGIGAGQATTSSRTNYLSVQNGYKIRFRIVVSGIPGVNDAILVGSNTASRFAVYIKEI